MRAAAKGPIRPYSISRTANAKEMSELAQPNSRCNGSIITAAEPNAPAVASIVTKVIPATNQPFKHLDLAKSGQDEP
jgi:hypothetical protein